MQKPAVIHLVPHIPIDEKDQRSAFHLLLLYGDWPDGLENSLVPEGSTAVETLDRVKHTLPEYIRISLEKRSLHETNLRNVGTPVGPNEDPLAATAEQFDEFLHDQHGLDDAATYEPDDLQDITAAAINLTPSSRIYEWATLENVKYLRNFIANLKAEQLQKGSEKLCMTTEEQTKN